MIGEMYKNKFAVLFIAMVLIVGLMLPACASKEAAPSAEEGGAVELSFEPLEYVNEDYGFSVKYPDEWVEKPEEEVRSIVFKAAYPAGVPGVSVSVGDADGLTWRESLIRGLEEDGSNVVVLYDDEVTLPDGTPATEGKVTFTTADGYDIVCLGVGVQKDSKWIKVLVWTVDEYLPYDPALFSEIAHTLQFK